jgi:hypothetical protein
MSLKTAASWAGRLPVSAGVLWTGIAAGVFVAVEAMVHGVFLPFALGVLADAALTFLVIVALAVVLAELTRRHHRTVAGHAARHGKRAIGYGRRHSAAGARLALRYGRAALASLAAKAGPRLAGRFRKPALFRRLRGEPDNPPEAAGGSGEESRTCHFCGQPLGPHDTGLAHQACRDRVRAKLSDPPPTSTTEGNTTMPASKIAPERRARRTAARTGSSVPSEWGPVIASAADFEPENDGELLEWMTRQLTGLSGWAEALVDFYEHCTQVIGIDPQASAMLHDVADAAAQAAETMGAAKAKFTQHYEMPREFAANGGLMTHDGRWITGEGA